MMKVSGECSNQSNEAVAFIQWASECCQRLAVTQTELCMEYRGISSSRGSSNGFVNLTQNFNLARTVSRSRIQDFRFRVLFSPETYKLGRCPACSCHFAVGDCFQWWVINFSFTFFQLLVKCFVKCDVNPVRCKINETFLIVYFAAFIISVQ